MILIFAVSSLSQPPTLPRGMTDTRAHAAAYAVLGGLLAIALAGDRRRHVGLAGVAAAVGWATLYGLTDELHQAFVPGRVPSMEDLLADAVGACVGAGAVWAWGIVSSMFPSTRADGRSTEDRP